MVIRMIYIDDTLSVVMDDKLGGLATNTRKPRRPSVYAAKLRCSEDHM
jgi:hypothetical protein